MSPNKRSDCTNASNSCPIHSSTSHNYETCTKKSDARLVCGINGCTKHRQHSLHNNVTPYVAGINALNAENDDTVLLPMQEISTSSGRINCYCHESSCCHWQQRKSQNGFLNESDRCLQLKAYNSGLCCTKDWWYSSGFFCWNKSLFSHKIPKEWDEVEARPSGEVELLVGSNYIEMHQNRVETNNNIQVLKSMFGTGYLLVVCHSALKSLEPQNSSISHVRGSICASNLTSKSIRDYLDSIELPFELPRRCGKCMKCKDCMHSLVLNKHPLRLLIFGNFSHGPYLDPPAY